MKMLLKKSYWKVLIIVFVLFCFQTPLVFAQQIRVVATFPDLADITRQIGKELVNVESLATGVEDAHGVPVKPSFVPRLNRADVLILIGLNDEHSWIPALLEVANNSKILPGRPGYIDCSLGISVLEVPIRMDRAEGDLHPNGNPHYLLDPVRAKIVAQNIATGLTRNFPQHQQAFDKNLKAYVAELDNWIVRWEKAAAPKAAPVPTRLARVRLCALASVLVLITTPSASRHPARNIEISLAPLLFCIYSSLLKKNKVGFAQSFHSVLNH